MGHAEDRIAEAVAHLNAQRPDAAVPAFVEALRHDLGAEQAWLGLALALALSGEVGQIIELADQRQASRGDGFLFCHAALGVLMTYRLHGAVGEFAANLPADSAYGPTGFYYAGCAALLAGAEDAAFAWFARFKNAIKIWEGRLPIGPESHFNIAYRQGSLIEDRAYVEALTPLDAVRDRIPVIEWRAEPVRGDRPLVLAAACDARYFIRFAPGFVASAARHVGDSIVHFHVIAPDDGTIALFERLRADYRDLALNLSIEAAGPFRGGAYYASSRFLIGPALLDRYRAPLMLLDIDIEFQAPLDDLLAAMDGCDFACFRHEGVGPCSRYPAVLTLWSASEGGRVLLDRVGRFVLSKLDVVWPFNWMLDQAALAATLRWARHHRPEIAAGIINDRTGRHFQPWLTSMGGGDEKAQMIRAVSEN